MLWIWIEKTETVMAVGDLDIWLGIVGIEEQRTELGREEDWNMNKG